MNRKPRNIRELEKGKHDTHYELNHVDYKWKRNFMTGYWQLFEMHDWMFKLLSGVGNWETSVLASKACRPEAREVYAMWWCVHNEYYWSRSILSNHLILICDLMLRCDQLSIIDFQLLVYGQEWMLLLLWCNLWVLTYCCFPTTCKGLMLLWWYWEMILRSVIYCVFQSLVQDWCYYCDLMIFSILSIG